MPVPERNPRPFRAGPLREALTVDNLNEGALAAEAVRQYLAGMDPAGDMVYQGAPQLAVISEAPSGADDYDDARYWCTFQRPSPTCAVSDELEVEEMGNPGNGIARGRTVTATNLWELNTDGDTAGTHTMYTGQRVMLHRISRNAAEHYWVFMSHPLRGLIYVQLSGSGTPPTYTATHPDTSATLGTGLTPAWRPVGTSITITAATAGIGNRSGDGTFILLVAFEVYATGAC